MFYINYQIVFQVLCFYSLNPSIYDVNSGTKALTALFCTIAIFFVCLLVNRFAKGINFISLGFFTIPIYFIMLIILIFTNNNS